MDAPSGHKDLLADAEEELRHDEELLADKRARVLELRRNNGNGSAELVIDSDGELVPVDPPPPPWKHETIDFYGEMWEVRKPASQALAAFSLASGKYIGQQMQNDMVGLFIKQHMSVESHQRVYERMMDPDDPEFTPATLGDLMKTIATLGTGRPTGPSQP